MVPRARYRVRIGGRRALLVPVRLARLADASERPAPAALVRTVRPVLAERRFRRRIVEPEGELITPAASGFARPVHLRGAEARRVAVAGESARVRVQAVVGGRALSAD